MNLFSFQSKHVLMADSIITVCINGHYEHFTWSSAERITRLVPTYLLPES